MASPHPTVCLLRVREKLSRPDASTLHRCRRLKVFSLRPESCTSYKAPYKKRFVVSAIPCLRERAACCIDSKSDLRCGMFLMASDLKGIISRNNTVLRSAETEIRHYLLDVSYKIVYRDRSKLTWCFEEKLEFAIISGQLGLTPKNKFDVF